MTTLASFSRSVEQRIDDLDALLQVSLGIHRSLELSDVLQTSLSGIQRVVGGDFGCFLLCELNAHTLTLAHATGLPSDLLEQFQSLTCDSEIANPANDYDPAHRLDAISRKVRAVLDARGIEPFLLIPLTAPRQVIGVLLAGMSVGKVLSPRMVDLLISIGEQIGMAIENARLHKSVSESEEWHRTFIENSTDGFWEGDFTGRITYVNDAACNILGFPRAALLHMRIQDLIVADSKTRRAAGKELREKGVLVNYEAQIRVKSGEIKTLHYNTRVVRDPQGEIVRHQSVFRDVTEQQHLVETLSRRSQEQVALNAIAHILSHPLEIKDSLDQICEQIVSITGMESAVLYLVDESQQFLNLLANRGVSDNLLNQIRRLGLDDPVTRSIAVEGKTLALNDLIEHMGEGFAGPRAEGYRAGIGIPILKRGVPAGTIFVGSKTKTRYEQSDVNLLLNIGSQIGVALENADLYVQMRQRVEELDGLAKLSAACTSSLDPQEISNLAVEWTQKLLQVDACSLRLLERESMRLGAARPHHPEAHVEERLALSEALQSVIETRVPFVMNDLQQVKPSLHRQYVQSHGINAALCIPLSVRDRVIGTLAVGRAEPHTWLPREIDLLQTIANQAANAIDNAQLFQNVLNEQRKVQAIFDSGLSGLFATDAEGRIMMFNRVAERITGWTLAEVQGKKWADIFKSATDSPVEPLVNEALARKETAYVHDGRNIRTRDGRVIPVAKAVAPLLDEKESVIGAVGAFWDLSKEQRIELAYENFLATVAHQLRSPLSAVLSALELFERRNLSEERRAELWAIIKTEGEQLKFADQFLDHQAAVKSLLPVRFQTLSIVTIARKLVRQFPAPKGKRCFRVRASKPEPLAYADVNRVENTLRNLLDNAVSYSPEGSRVTIAVRAQDDDWVDIAVQDQGPGIPIAEQDSVFKPFYRSTQTGGQRVYGHGLGLAIAKEMVSQMGGNIWVASEPNHGATFHFTLRRAR